MSYWPFSLRQDKRIAAKDEQIAQLEKQVQGLTKQNTKLAEEKALLVAEKERLELTWKTHCDDLQTRYDRVQQEATERFETIAGLRKENAEWDAANVHLQEHVQAMHTSLAELLPFLRSMRRGVFRSDRGGSERYEELRSLVKKYDESLLIGE